MIKTRILAACAAAIGILSVAGSGWSQPPQPASAQATLPKAPIVGVTGGRIEGVITGDVAVYRGVPYAAAPIGDLRWRAPQPVRAWTGVRNASANGATCNTNEDCLFLNVFKPASARAGANLPVMVWIHGGAFTGGSANIYDAPNFAKKDIVAVVINYRLGRQGWFSHPALTRNAPAGEAVSNWGLQDQIAALKWVQTNARAFGGNPRNVTIFGESAGGISVNYLMISPQATGGLFHKAISQSGFGRLDPIPLAQSEQAGAQFFTGLGVTGDTPATVAAMRAIPFARLQGGLGLGAAGVIMDGKTVNISTAEGFAQGRQAKIPYLLGGNSNEASLLGTPNPAARLAALTAQREAMLAAFDPNRTGEAGRIINLIVTDNAITEPDRWLARQHVRTGQPTYVYYFSYLPPAQRATSLGLAHGGEIGYVFGRGVNTPEDLATSQAANAYWASFAKYGDPGAAGGAPWPRYDMASEARMEFGVQGPMVRTQFAKARLDWAEANRAQIAASAAAGSTPAAGAAPATGRGGAGAGGRGGGRGGAGRGGGRGG